MLWLSAGSGNAPPIAVVETRLGRRAVGVLDECDPVSHRAAIWKQAGEEARRRRPAEFAELAVEVGLVGVSAARRDLGPVPRLGADPPPDRVEAQQPREGLRRQPDLLAEAG